MGNIQSTPPPSTTTINDVFLSFRGENTRNTFTSHLYEALCKKDIKTFIDNKLGKGNPIGPNLSKNIRESKISVVIFSKDYASSKWCLRELVEIMECNEKNGQIVVPVFYHVDPSHVRKQVGSFKDSFVKHEKEFPEEAPKWREALTAASNLTGWDSSVTKPEATLVDEIVRDIEKKLMNGDIWSSSDFEGLIGLDKRIEGIISLLCLHKTSDIRIIGISGMGGIGKTTIARVIFKKISDQSHQFEGKCFIGNVRERLEQCGGLVDSLQREFISQVLNDDQENLKLDGSTTFSKKIKERLSQKKVFIVLDDVDDLIKLEELVGGLNQFGPGSRIMMTSREKQVLLNCVRNKHKIYEVKGLNYFEALKLFCNYAFKQDQPTKDLKVVSEMIANYAKGNPLALKVLGSLLFQKSKEVWKSAISNLQTNFKGRIFDVLKISYDRLDDEEKNIFLDIACFFKGNYARDVAKLCGDSCSHLLSVLEDKSLIVVGIYGVIEMHDLLQEMGREIVRKESNKPGNRSRLWRQEDVLDTLKNGDGTDAVQGMVLNMNSLVEDTDLSPQAFEQMKNLRFIQFWTSWSEPSTYKMHYPNGDLIYLSNQLRSITWVHCPLKVLPSAFKPENLIELNLSFSNLERLWEGTMSAPKLKWLMLKGSRHLTSISKCLDAPLLEGMVLEHCEGLLDFPLPVKLVHDLNLLRVLNLQGCKNLKQLPSKIHCESLRSLDVSGCINLRRIPDVSKASLLEKINLKDCKNLLDFPRLAQQLRNLYELNLDGCKNIKSFPSNIHFESLRSIDLSGCINLRRIPDLSKASLLEKIILEDCESLLDFPRLAQHLQCLYKLNLVGCKNIKSFPNDIHFESLPSLDLSGYNNLIKFPQISGNITELNLSGTAIDEVPSSIQNLPKLSILNLSECTRLDLISTSICELKSLLKLNLKNCSKLMKFPEILDTMKSMEFLDLSGTAIKELPNSIIHMPGLLKLHLRNCRNLEKLPNNICNLISLAYLDFSDCSKLKIWQENLKNLKDLVDLSMDRVAIIQLPDGMRHFNKLKRLSCCGYRGLLFTYFSNLPGSLKELYLSDCNLKEIPEDIDYLSTLEYIVLSGNNFESLPESFRQSNVSYLNLDNCDMLQSLTDLPLNLQYISASDCKQLRSIPDLSVASFIFTNCLNLKETEVSNILERVIKEKVETHDQEEYECEAELSFCCPGSKVPGWFNYQNDESWIQFQTEWHDGVKGQLMGFVVCAVIEFNEYLFEGKEKDRLTVCYEGAYNDKDAFQNGKLVDCGIITVASRNGTLIDSDHVALKNTIPFFLVPEPNFIYKFRLSENSCHCRVKSCGVYPVYKNHNITSPSSSNENFGATNQDFGESSGEQRNKIRKFLDEAETSGGSNDNAKEPHPKRTRFL